MKAEICLFKNLASHAGSEFLTCVLPACGCVDLPLEAENELFPLCACATAVSGRADVRIPAARYAHAAHVSTGITHSVTWMLPAIGSHHLAHSQDSPFPKQVALMDEMASPRSPACLSGNSASLARMGFHFKHVSRMETSGGESKCAKEKRL